jgi:hypothetical protein
MLLSYMYWPARLYWEWTFGIVKKYGSGINAATCHKSLLQVHVLSQNAQPHMLVG